jgi:RNA polymerase sigma-70 factor (ECF subfamily)
MVYNRNGTLRAYLSTIAYRLAIKESMRQKKLAPAEDAELASSDQSPLDDVIAEDQQREVVRAIRALPAHHQEILVLRFHGDHSYGEIAEITGLPLGTVKSRIFHAVKSVRSEMKKRGVI